MISRANLYFRDDLAVIVRKIKVNEHLWVDVPPAHLTMRRVGAEKIVSKLASVLDSQEPEKPDNPGSFDLFDPILDAFGSESYEDFMNSMSAITVEKTDKTVTVTPMINRGPSYGFMVDRDSTIHIDSSSGSLETEIQRLVC